MSDEGRRAKDKPTRYAIRNTQYAFVLALAAGIARLLFVRTTPANWDAVQFALAVEHFDLHAHQPHPPGYILYVLAGRVVNLLVNNPSVALGLLSGTSSMLLVPLIYWMGMSIFEDRGIALGAALLATASPLALYYGSVGLTYLPEMVLSMWVGGLAWSVKARYGVWNVAAWLGIALGVAGGVRQTTLLVLLPLCVWALWGADRKTTVVFVGALTTTCALWLVPLLAMSGGVEAYLGESVLLAQTAVARTSVLTAGLEGLAYNVGFEGLGLVVGLAFGAIPLGLWALRALRFSLSSRLRAWLAWWIVPPLLFYAVSHVGQYGYLLFVLPPLFLMSAVCLRVLAEKLTEGHRESGAGWAGLGCACLSLLSAGYFLLAEGPTTMSNINRNDAHWQEVRGSLSKMDSLHTVLIMGMEWSGPFRLAGYLLPEYHSYAAEEDPAYLVGWLYSAYGGRSTYALPHPAAQLYLRLPPGISTVVALDDSTGAMMAGHEGLRRVPLYDGSTLYILDSTAGIQGLTIGGGTIKMDEGPKAKDEKRH